MADGLKGGNDQIQIFLRRQSPDVQHHRRLRGGAPLLTQRCITAVRRKQGGVHAPRQHLGVLKTEGLELLGQFSGRHEGLDALIMEMAQIGPDWPRQPAEVVMAAVAVKVSVETGGGRNRQPSRRPQRRVTQRAFGDDMNQIGSGPPPVLQQSPLRWPPALQLWIAGNPETGQSQGVQRIR